MYFAFSSYGQKWMYDNVPPSIMQEFHKYDLDSSGTIDPIEFTSIAMDLRLEINEVASILIILFCINIYRYLCVLTFQCLLVMYRCLNNPFTD